MPNGAHTPNLPSIKELARLTLESAPTSVRNYLPPVYQNLPGTGFPLPRACRLPQSTDSSGASGASSHSSSGIRTRIWVVARNG